MFVFAIVVGGMAAAAPPAPTPLGPVNGASVTVPATMSWSAVPDPTERDHRLQLAGQLVADHDTAGLRGLDRRHDDPGHAERAGDRHLFLAGPGGEQCGQRAWSPAQSFTVTGAGPGTPGTPVLNPTRGYSTFHPWESVHFSWSAVAGRADLPPRGLDRPELPATATGCVTFWNENIRGTTDGFVHHPSLGEGTFYARVFATDSDFVGGIRSLPSNVIQYTVFYNNPIGPAPVLISPSTTRR